MKVDIPEVIISVMTAIGAILYFAFVLIFVALIFMVYPARGQEHFTCEDVKWAVENLSKDTLDMIKTKMTDEQIAAAKKCLQRNARRKVPKRNYNEGD